jgi:hypothetical protein
LHELPVVLQGSVGPNNLNSEHNCPSLRLPISTLTESVLIDSNFFVAPSARCVPTKTQRSISFSFEATFHQFGADARHIAIITLPLAV